MRDPVLREVNQGEHEERRRGVNHSQFQDGVTFGDMRALVSSGHPRVQEMDRESVKGMKVISGK